MPKSHSIGGLYGRSRDGVLIAKFIIVTLFAVLNMSCAGELEKSKVPELRKIAEETPLYPGFQKHSERKVLKRGIVYLFTYYRCNAQFPDVKRFYDEELAHNGWGPPQQAGPSIFVSTPAHSVSYRRGDYVITVEQDGRQEDNFLLVFEWDPE